MIINPSEDDPKHHLSLHSYRLRAKDELGRTTIRTLYLNDSDRLVKMRFDIGEQVITNLETIRDALELYIGGPQSAYRRGKVISMFSQTLREAQPDSVYSATVATVIVQSDDYRWIVENMQRVGLWNYDFDVLCRQAEQLALV